MRPRRFLPSISQLAAFDAVVRHQSVTAAAEELNLTQSTVSRLIQSLETQLGKELFARQRKRLLPNAVALVYQREVARALDRIQRASMAVVVNPEGGTLTLAVLPTFASRWLGPRLGRFLATHPGVSVNVSTRTQRVDLREAGFDAAIHFGTDDWPGVEHLKLFDERMTACAAPDLAAGLNGDAALARAPLLHLESRPAAWGDWFAAQGLPAPAGAGMLVDQFAVMVQAAISGLGLALLPEYLARDEIAAGRLVPIGAPAVAIGGAYWLTWPPERTDDAPLRAFRAWLSAETA
ncbi:MAG: LysR family transcriptional regulator [Rhodobacter sp.]|nr:LysR family transcriptional regulator [Paracoccaceae bacterium]MCC0077115.1 LysR family transcriptional regulator [Rhodobacter sp.]